MSPGTRRRAISFVLALVFALAVAGWKGWTLWRAQQPQDPDMTIRVGRTVTLGGSSYRVDGFSARTSFPNQDPKEPAVKAPAGSMLVLVTVTTEILDRSINPKTHYCSASLRDDRGRTWDTEPDIAYSIKRPEAVSCNGTSDHDIVPGRPLQVGFGFLVPATAADRLALELQVTSGRDYTVTVTR